MSTFNSGDSVVYKGYRQFLFGLTGFVESSYVDKQIEMASVRFPSYVDKDSPLWQLPVIDLVRAPSAIPVQSVLRVTPKGVVATDSDVSISYPHTCPSCGSPALRRFRQCRLFGRVLMTKQSFWDFHDDVQEELVRAFKKHGPQGHLLDSTDNPAARETWETIARNSCDRAFREGRLTHSHILDEEVAEALTAAAKLTEGTGTMQELRKELIQVAAMCAQWIEALDTRPDETIEEALAKMRALPCGLPFGGVRFK